jgi:hypothetical protein
MSESIPTRSEKEPTRKERIIALAIELDESQETFPFPGIDPESYAKMKADEEEYPGYTTPIDELVESYAKKGITVMLGKNPQSGNVFILPRNSDNIEMDSISPKQLRIIEGMNEKLRELILLVRG